MTITRGFKGRGRLQTEDRGRIPPGQFVTKEFPVLTAGPTRHIPHDRWTITLEHEGETLRRWSWRDLELLHQTEIVVDIHCVTKWTKFDTHWGGVLIDDLLAAAGLLAPPAPFVIASGDGGYTTNLPIAEVIGGKAMIATSYDGMPIPAEHGGPARLLVPGLYFWKSAKWLEKLDFVSRDQPGFWETLGYHNQGDPWREQRYEGDA